MTDDSEESKELTIALQPGQLAGALAILVVIILLVRRKRAGQS